MVMLASCAQVERQPLAAPASIPIERGLADIAEIPIDRCSPPLVGVFMSHQALADVLSGFEVEKGELRIQLAKENARAEIEAEQAQAARAKLSEIESSWWYRHALPIGIVIGLVSGSLVVGVGGWAISRLQR